MIIHETNGQLDMQYRLRKHIQHVVYYTEQHHDMEAKEKQAYLVVSSDENLIDTLPVPDPKFFWYM